MPVISGKKHENVKVARPNGTRYAEGAVEEPAALFLTLTSIAIGQALDAFVAEFGYYPGEKGYVVTETVVIGSRGSATIFELDRE